MSILLKHEIELHHKFGYRIDEIGVHSWRKGAHTYMNSGSTAGPSAAATCIRGGHTMGAVRDIYVLHEKAGDHYCGRILAGLPINEARFAASHPDFVPVEDGMSEADLREKQAEVDEAVNRALDEIFGKQQIDDVINIRPYLRIGLASHLQHRTDLEAVYPPDAIIRSTTVFTSSSVFEMKKFVKIAMPWGKNGKKAFATGIPPHTILLAGNEEIKEMLKDLIPRMESCMDDRTMSGNLSESRMRLIVDTQTRQFANEVSDIKRILLEQTRKKLDANVNARNPDGFNRWAVNGIYRRVPSNWIFPLGPVLMFIYTGTTEMK